MKLLFLNTVDIPFGKYAEYGIKPSHPKMIRLDIDDITLTPITLKCEDKPGGKDVRFVPSDHDKAPYTLLEIGKTSIFFQGDLDKISRLMAEICGGSRVKAEEELKNCSVSADGLEEIKKMTISRKAFSFHNTLSKLPPPHKPAPMPRGH